MWSECAWARTQGASRWRCGEVPLILGSRYFVIRCGKYEVRSTEYALLLPTVLSFVETKHARFHEHEIAELCELIHGVKLNQPHWRLARWCIPFWAGCGELGGSIEGSKRTCSLSRIVFVSCCDRMKREETRNHVHEISNLENCLSVQGKACKACKDTRGSQHARPDRYFAIPRSEAMPPIDNTCDPTTEHEYGLFVHASRASCNQKTWCADAAGG